jgi:hypothetical protein
MWSSQQVSLRDRIRGWYIRNEKRLVALNICSLILLCFAYLFTLVINLYSAELQATMHTVIIISAAFILLSLVSKGPIPLLISIIGVVLIYNAVISPLYASPENSQMIVERQRVDPATPSESVQVDRPLHFGLGVGMVIFATIIAYRPSTLFTRNRPASAYEEWASYPLWRDNTVLKDGRNEDLIPVKDMMTEQDVHLLWRYEFVLANVAGSQHLVRPDGLVPRDSTTLLRDKASGRLLGKPRFSGLFI